MSNTWQNAMKVGIEVVDEDHRQLFALIQEFHAAADSQGGVVNGEQMAGILSRLDAYVKEHFAREELLQVEAGYDGYEENKRQHDELTHTLAVFIEKFHSGAAGATPSASSPRTGSTQESHTQPSSGCSTQLPVMAAQARASRDTSAMCSMPRSSRLATACMVCSR